MNFYKHYIGDFQRDTGHLSLTQRGAYLALMHHYYATEKPLPSDFQALCRIAGAATKDERDAVKSIMPFFQQVDSGLMHKRIEAELEKAGKQSDTNRRIAEEREAKRRAEREAARKKDEPSTNRATNRGTDGQTIGSTNDQPNQTPDTRQIPPIPPGGVSAGKRAKASAVSLPTWLEQCKAAGEKPIPEDDPIFAYAEQIDLPSEFLRLCWRAFRDHYGQPDAKRYKDWRSVFRKAVRGNWLKLWWASDSGYALTTQGQQAKRAAAERVAEAA